MSDAYELLLAKVKERIALAEAASLGPWELGDVWLRAGAVDKDTEYVKAGQCAYCGHHGDPVHIVPPGTINGKELPIHVHRNQNPWEPTRSISGADYFLVFPGVTDDGEMIEEEDAAFIVANNPAVALVGLRADLKLIQAHQPRPTDWGTDACPACSVSNSMIFSPCSTLRNRFEAYQIQE